MRIPVEPEDSRLTPHQRLLAISGRLSRGIHRLRKRPHNPSSIKLDPCPKSRPDPGALTTARADEEKPVAEDFE